MLSDGRLMYSNMWPIASAYVTGKWKMWLIRESNPRASAHCADALTEVHCADDLTNWASWVNIRVSHTHKSLYNSDRLCYNFNLRNTYIILQQVLFLQKPDWCYNFPFRNIYNPTPGTVSYTNLTSADDNVSFYLTVYGILAGANTFFTLARAFLFAYGGICAAQVLHTDLLSTILKVSYYTPRNKVRGGILESPCPSIRLSVVHIWVSGA